MQNHIVKKQYFEDISAQIKLWYMFLNNATGLLAFTLALASLGTPYPTICSGLSLLIIFLVHFEGKKYFPKELKKLRKKAKNDEEARDLLHKLERKYLSLRALITETPVYIIGFTSLFIVFASSLKEIIKCL